MSSARNILFALLVLVQVTALAQGFPSKAVTIICPVSADTPNAIHLRGLAEISSKYLGKPIRVEFRPTKFGFAPENLVTSVRPDGYVLSQLLIGAFQLPHRERVQWDPTRDLTYVIGIAALTFGVVVKTDSQFNSIFDLLRHARDNPGEIRFGSFGNTPYLNMLELSSKAGVRLTHVPGTYPQSADLLAKGVIQAISGSTVWAPDVDSGAFRLLVTFGERRSRWNAPTAKEIGLDILSYSPFGIVGPKGMDSAVVKVLHNAFFEALDDPEYDKLIRKLDMVDWYKSSEDYSDWAIDQFNFQRSLIERTTGSGRRLQN